RTELRRYSGSRRRRLEPPRQTRRAYARYQRNSIKWDFEITAPILFLRRQSTACDIHLQRRQHQIGQGKAAIPLVAKFDERAFVMILQMEIVRLLLGDGAFPARFPTAWTIVVAGKQARVVGQLENPLNAPPDLKRVASGKIGARRSRIWHEHSVVHKGRVADDVGHGAQRVARG